jgi:phospholipid/cholesterol/gamma-HCH transport system substrate-binding protein
MPESKKLIVGLFLVGGFLLFGLGLFLIGDRRLLFTESMILFTEFTNISALKQGSKVRVSGMDAGEVLDIAVPADPESKFRVRFRVLAKFQPILRKDSITSVQTDGLVGNKFLQVEPGSAASPPVNDGDTIPGKEPIEFGALIDTAVDTVKNINSAVDEVRAHMDETVDLLADVNKQAVGLINDVGGEIGKIATIGTRVVEDLGTIVKDIQGGKGSIGKLVNDEAMYKSLKEVVDQAEATAKNLSEISEDMKKVSTDLRESNLVNTVEQTAVHVRDAAERARAILTGFQPSGPSDEGMSADLRQTLKNAEEATNNLAESTRALKRNFLFRGFFNNRGFFDLDNVSVEDYAAGKFARDRERLREWVHAQDLFQTKEDGSEELSEQGRKKLDDAVAGFLRYAANSPLIVEGYSAAAAENEQYLRSRDRGFLVRSYLVRRYDLNPNYIGVMPMGSVESSSPDGKPWDGVALVVYPPKGSVVRGN